MSLPWLRMTVDLPTAERGSKDNGVVVDLVAGNDGAATDRRAVAGEGRRGDGKARWQQGGVGPLGLGEARF